MTGQDASTISFKIDSDNISIFSPALQQGFKVAARVGCSLKSMLCDQFDVTPAYLSQRITTIFLNGQPVDDVEFTIINDGAVVALSAAMPGLVGATFRTGGPLSVFRSSISHRHEKKASDLPREGMVTLKFFNLLILEMGPIFLGRGIWVKPGIINDLIGKNKTNNQEGVFKSIQIDGQETNSHELKRWVINDTGDLVHVTVQIEK